MLIFQRSLAAEFQAQKPTSALTDPIRSTVDIYYQNVRGVRTKADTLFSNVSLSGLSIVCLTETCLCSGISSSNCFPPNFDVHRRDCEGYGAGKMRSGVLGGWRLVTTTADAFLLAFSTCFLKLPWTNLANALQI